MTAEQQPPQPDREPQPAPAYDPSGAPRPGEQIGVPDVGVPLGHEHDADVGDEPAPESA